MAFFEIKGQALRDFDAKRKQEPARGLMSASGSLLGGSGAATPKPAYGSGWGNQSGDDFRASLQKHRDALSAGAPRVAGGGADLAAAGVMARPVKPAPVPSVTTPKTDDQLIQGVQQNFGESPFKGLGVNWQQVQGNRMNQMRADIGEQRAAQERAARVSANQRGLMSGGNSALAQGQMARIAENAAMASQRGGLMIANDIDNQARDYDMRLAGAEAGWRMGAPGALTAAMLLPGAVQRQGIDNATADYGLYGAKQMLPIQLGNLAAQGDATRANIEATGANTQGQNLQNTITQEQASQIKDTLDRLRRKEEQGIALTEMELQQKKWANDNSWWLAPLGLVAGALPGLGQAAGAMGWQPFAAK